MNSPQLELGLHPGRRHPYEVLHHLPGQPLALVRDAVGVIPDSQWHQYVATFDGQNAYFYEDGQLVSQNWISNTADNVGPQVFSTTLSTPTAITYSANGFSAGWTSFVFPILP